MAFQMGGHTAPLPYSSQNGAVPFRRSGSSTGSRVSTIRRTDGSGKERKVGVLKSMHCQSPHCCCCKLLLAAWGVLRVARDPLVPVQVAAPVGMLQ